MDTPLQQAYALGAQRAFDDFQKVAETPDWMRAGPMVGALAGAALLHPKFRKGLLSMGDKISPRHWSKVKANMPKIVKGIGVIGAGTTVGWLPQLMYEGREASGNLLSNFKD